ncbi:hypothetical protein [Arthrobacter sp. ISL-5]|uniref:hypothetical protein n=1 Tax=Arthrobacter sp. ISL-5 TaxID=2819111 RepID=UPI001BE6B906|nr:hypothetical protein [Arthrobacter sp. ISL-5]MBT2555269.1 hypothetical protein [Arthrobacter sp. ISL-5]
MRAQLGSPRHPSLTSAYIHQGQIIRLGSSASALRTFELRRDPLSDQWLLESITDN